MLECRVFCARHVLFSIGHTMAYQTHVMFFHMKTYKKNFRLAIIIIVILLLQTPFCLYVYIDVSQFSLTAKSGQKLAFDLITVEHMCTHQHQQATLGLPIQRRHMNKRGRKPPKEAIWKKSVFAVSMVALWSLSSWISCHVNQPGDLSYILWTALKPQKLNFIGISYNFVQWSQLFWFISCSLCSTAPHHIKNDDVRLMCVLVLCFVIFLILSARFLCGLV